MVRKVFLVSYEEVGRGGVSLWLTKVSTNALREINSLSRGRQWRFPFDSGSGTPFVSALLIQVRISEVYPQVSKK